MKSWPWFFDFSCTVVVFIFLCYSEVLSISTSFRLPHSPPKLIKIHTTHMCNTCFSDIWAEFCAAQFHWKITSLWLRDIHKWRHTALQIFSGGIVCRTLQLQPSSFFEQSIRNYTFFEQGIGLLLFWPDKSIFT